LRVLALGCLASVEPAPPSVRSPAWPAWSPHPRRWVCGEHTCPPGPGARA